MKNLYRRYRPLRLSEVVGQDQVTKPLQNALAEHKTSHAYLFVGPRGCGKTSVARILAHEINDFKYELEDEYVDIIEIDGASNRGVDNIRELRERVMIAPTSGKYKVYIIDEVHMLTKEAFNALLKTLEEPPEHTVFIMATTDAYKVPVTITSRAQVYTFKLADEQTMLEFLKTVAEKEKIAVVDEALRIIAKRGGGSFRDTLSLLDQISTLSSEQITPEMVVAALGLPQDEKITELLDSYKSGEITNIAQILKDLLNSGVKAETLAEEIMARIIETPEKTLLPLLAKLPDVKAPFAEARLLVALAGTNLLDGTYQKQLPPRHSARPAPKVNLQSAGLETAPEVATKHDLKSSARRQASAERSSDEMPRQEEVSEKTASSAEKTREEVTTAPVNKSADFDWDDYLKKVQQMNDAVYSQLAKTQHTFDEGTLHIYPMKKIVKSILSRDNNKRILVDAAGGDVKITIHDEKETPVGAEKDEVLAKISDIMGGEVQNDRGGDPF